MAKILVIEDEVAIAELEKDYLELSGFEVILETDGRKGLTTALTQEVQLVLLDLMLPGLDGFEICRQIREEKDIPFGTLNCTPIPLKLPSSDSSATESSSGGR